MSDSGQLCAPVDNKYHTLVFDRGLRGKNAASRVLGVGHTLFDIALDEARALLSGIAEVEEILTPLLIVSVEDEVTGTGALVNRLIFGVTEQEEEVAVLRDWELFETTQLVFNEERGKLRCK